MRNVFLVLVLAGCGTPLTTPAEVLLAIEVTPEGATRVYPVAVFDAGAAPRGRAASAGALHFMITAGEDGSILEEGYRPVYFETINELFPADGPPRGTERLEESVLEFLVVPEHYLRAPGAYLELSLRGSDGTAHPSHVWLPDLAPRVALDSRIGARREAQRMPGSDPLDIGLAAACMAPPELAGDCSACTGPDRMCVGGRCLENPCPRYADHPMDEDMLVHLEGGGDRRIVLLGVGFSTGAEFRAYAEEQVERVYESDWFAENDFVSFYAYMGECGNLSSTTASYGRHIGHCALQSQPELVGAYKIAMLDRTGGCGGETRILSPVLGMGYCEGDAARQWILAHELGHAIAGFIDEYPKDDYRECDNDPVTYADYLARPNVDGDPTDGAKWWCAHATGSCANGGPVGMYAGVGECANQYAPCATSVMRSSRVTPDFGDVHAAAMTFSVQNDALHDFGPCSCTPAGGAADTCGPDDCGYYYDNCTTGECRITINPLTGGTPMYECEDSCAALGLGTCYTSVALEVCTGDDYLSYNPRCGETGFELVTCTAPAGTVEQGAGTCLAACSGGETFCAGTTLCPGARACVADAGCGGWRPSSCDASGTPPTSLGDCRPTRTSCEDALCDGAAAAACGDGCAWHGCGAGGAGRCAADAVDGCLVCPLTYPGCPCAHADAASCDADPACDWNPCGAGGACAPAGTDPCLVCPDAC